MKLREEEGGRGTPLGKSDNPLNIFTWANVQASFNPSNPIKHTQQHPWAPSHILKDLRAEVWYTRITSDEFCQFSPLSTNLSPNAPFIASCAHQPSQAAWQFTARLCMHVYCPILTTRSYKRTHFFKAQRQTCQAAGRALSSWMNCVSVQHLLLSPGASYRCLFLVVIGCWFWSEQLGLVGRQDFRKYPVTQQGQGSMLQAAF